MRFSFEVGDSERHTVEMELSPLGKEVYKVDGQEVLALWSFSIRGEREFQVGREERHQVKVLLDMLPTWKSWLFPVDWRAEVYVDGKLHIADFTPDLRRKVRLFDRGLNYVFVVCLSVFVVIVAAVVLLDLLRN